MNKVVTKVASTVAIAVAAVCAPPNVVHAEPDGAALYDRLCLACHGEAGDGAGPATPWLWPRPRDFTRGEFKWRTTPSGFGPTDSDLAAAIRFGVPGTSMHPFGDVLDDDEIAALVSVVKSFADTPWKAGELAEIGPTPPQTQALRKRGEVGFERLGCVHCHGVAARGGAKLAETLRDSTGLPAPPYDLTTQPLRRPRAEVSASAMRDIYLSLVTGLAGTAMPAYAGVPSEDLWAVAAYLDSIRHRSSKDDKPVDATLVHPQAIKLDRTEQRARGGYWSGNPAAESSRIFGRTISLQGHAPAALPPAAASLSAKQCARCHASQYRQWQTSLHASAASPGLIAQLVTMKNGATIESCQRCHAPLAEQQPVLRAGQRGGKDGSNSYRKSPWFEPELRAEGLNCASCHVRNWQRHGPGQPEASKLMSSPGYPSNKLAVYERADFCLPCHQLPPRNARKGKPLLNTYREWLEGPYMRRGIQCQHCHMPSREHTWKGIHDPDTFRQGVKLEAIAGRSSSGTVSVRARLGNVGAGHYLPTTPTPAVWLSVQLVDGAGAPIAGASAEKRIGRWLVMGKGGLQEREDTRIPPGESIELASGWKDGDVARATHARVSVRVVPDDYYEGLYESRLRRRLSADVRAMFQDALQRARDAQYEALTRLVPVSRVENGR